MELGDEVFMEYDVAMVLSTYISYTLRWQTAGCLLCNNVIDGFSKNWFRLMFDSGIESDKCGNCQHEKTLTLLKSRPLIISDKDGL